MHQNWKILLVCENFFFNALKFMTTTNFKKHNIL
jgi:hypothetical protein